MNTVKMSKTTTRITTMTTIMTMITILTMNVNVSWDGATVAHKAGTVYTVTLGNNKCDVESKSVEKMADGQMWMSDVEFNKLEACLEN